MEDSRGYITRAELDKILADYVKQESLTAILNHEWRTLRRRLRFVFADAMTACARAWLPDNPAHLAEAAALMGSFAADHEGSFVRDLESEISAQLRQNSPLH